MTLRIAALLLLASLPMLADLTGRWTVTGKEVFVLHQEGNSLTGEIVSPGERTYKIVDGVVRGNEVYFFVLHDAVDDPEVVANGGNAFHNTARGTFTENEISVSGSRENTRINEYQMVLRRIQ